MALSNVVVEIGSDGEASIATLIGTFERLDALMESQVLPEVARLRVRLAAHLAQVVARTCRHLVNAAASDRNRLLDALRGFGFFVNFVLNLLEMGLEEMLDELLIGMEACDAKLA